jgi:hypothetical protein
MRRASGGGALAALAAALLGAGCDDGSHHTTTTARITLTGDDAVTTLAASATRRVGGHGDTEVYPRTGLDLLGGASPGELVELVEVEPGSYRVQLPGVAARAVRYRLEGHDYLHDGPQHFTAAATLVSAEPPAAFVTWDPPLDPRFGREELRVGILLPSGMAPPFGCGSYEGILVMEGGRLDLPDCALTERGTYRVSVRRRVGGTGDESNGDFLYAWATVEVVRELTFDVP